MSLKVNPQNILIIEDEDGARKAIRYTLKLTGGNKSKAAEILDIDTRILYRKIEEYGL